MRTLLKTIGISVVLAAMITLLGCETESASDNSVRISPARIRVTNGQQVQFTASGGFSYSWAISDSTLGFLSTKTGPTTTYIANFEAPTNSVTVQTLTVTSVVGSGGSNNTTTASGFTKTAEAIIEHGPSSTSAPAPVAPGALAVSPSSGVTLSAQGNQLFTASGEGPDYSWTITDVLNGNISTTEGSQTIYTYQTLVVADTTVFLTVSSNGKSVSVPILLILPPSTP